jgi:DNA-binding GntR family transcriptional regulator
MPRALRPSVRRPGSAAAAASGQSAQRVYDALFDAVMSRRLAPGTRLGEMLLCEAFEVSRTVVRQALHRLAELRIVEIVPHKGASVAAPGPDETREVFAARRVIEAAIVRAAAPRIGTRELARLRERLQAEHDALQRHDQARWAHLAGGFHLALAELAGNRELLRMLTELMSRCSLIVALYEAPGAASCEHDEHEALIERLALQDAEGAVALMDAHLLGLESRLQVTPAHGGSDLAAALRQSAR